MEIARYWECAARPMVTERYGAFDLEVWGWSPRTPADAATRALQRLDRQASRLVAGEDFLDAYAYDARPSREEIVEELGSAEEADSFRDCGPEGAILTRNGPGVVVLNAAQLFVADIDLPRQGWGLARRLLRRPEPSLQVLDAVRGVLARTRGAFRIYRTAAGFRVLRVDAPMLPGADDTVNLHEALSTDPRYARLCTLQSCFRARLSPKPWRVGMRRAPGRHPRDDVTAPTFAAWRAEYDRRAANVATCHLVENVGAHRPHEALHPLIDLHDTWTGAATGRPLA